MRIEKFVGNWSKYTNKSTIISRQYKFTFTDPHLNIHVFSTTIHSHKHACTQLLLLLLRQKITTNLINLLKVWTVGRSLAVICKKHRWIVIQHKSTSLAAIACWCLILIYRSLCQAQLWMLKSSTVSQWTADIAITWYRSYFKMMLTLRGQNGPAFYLG